MKEACNRGRGGGSERGGSRLNFLIVAVLIAIIANACYQYIPVAYQSYLYQDQMQHFVDVAAASGFPASWVKDQLAKNEIQFGVPPDAVISVTAQDSRVEARVKFSQP